MRGDSRFDRLLGRLGNALLDRLLTSTDGVFTAALEDMQLGIALKIDDGTREAAEVTLLAVLNHLGVLNDDELEALAERRRMPIRNTLGVLTGHREPAEIWLDGDSG